MNHDSGQCPICGGSKTDGAITFTADLQETLVVVRGVPATVCALCGNEWLNDATAAVLEQIVEDARKKSCLVEVAQFSTFVQSTAANPLHAA
jgi:YgiT-type zinc finger domain-containing protein